MNKKITGTGRDKTKCTHGNAECGVKCSQLNSNETWRLWQHAEEVAQIEVFDVKNPTTKKKETI